MRAERQRQSVGDVQSAIDLGTNTILMVTGRLNGEGIEILDDAHEIARLGQGVDEHRRILPETVERVCRFLDQYRRRAHELGATRICAFGTSALRDAANRQDFIDTARMQAGVELRELSGEQEAAYTFSGAAFGLDVPAQGYAVIDIGGGSTELASGRPGRLERSLSVDIGAVRLTERHFNDLPPTDRQRRAAEQTVEGMLDRFFDLPSATNLVGVAGTVTTLGALDAGVERFDRRELDGYVLGTEAVHELSDRLLGMTHEQIRALPQVNEQRADIIGAGSLILRAFLRRQALPGLTVSTRGIRYGLLRAMLDGGL